MLVITRRAGESIVIGDNITMTVLDTGNAVRIGIEAPREIDVHREEVYVQVAREKYNRFLLERSET